MVLRETVSASLPDVTTAQTPWNTEANFASAANAEQLKQLITDIAADTSDLEKFYNIGISRTRVQEIAQNIVQRYNEVVVAHNFGSLDQDGRVDWLLIYHHVRAQRARLQKEWSSIGESISLLGTWVHRLVRLCERRQRVAPIEGKDAAQVLDAATAEIKQLRERLRDWDATAKKLRLTAFRATGQLEQLLAALNEWHSFYGDYDPSFTWWTSKPFEQLGISLQDLIAAIREEVLGITPGDDDVIVGMPIGREGINAELQNEWIAYSPEELMEIAERQYAWCEHEAVDASNALGFGGEWRKAMNHVKNMHAQPGQQARLVHELAEEAISYVKKHDLVTVPEVASSTWRTHMLPPENLKISPFFLYDHGAILVASPTTSMSHSAKLVIMRANCKPMSRSTVLHELIPGHHLQAYYMKRSKPHRQLFYTPFYVEGWAFYWELLLWDRGFPGTAENKLGMLFWHMHRCARIVFSLKFHLGQWTPQQCIDYLVEKVGHERGTAESEVRRSFNGDYGALYQAGYMVGALQLYALRREMVESGLMGEKEFHDRVLRENCMPIELLRALLKGEPLQMDSKATWRFYNL